MTLTDFRLLETFVKFNNQGRDKLNHLVIFMGIHLITIKESHLKPLRR